MNLIKSKKGIKRIKTNIENFDEQLDGGIPTGFVNLIAGQSGTMKSSIAFNLLYHSITNGKNGVYISLEQSAVSLLNHMIALGFDLSEIEILVVTDIGNLDEKMIKAKGKKKVLILTDVGAIRKELKDMKKQNPDSDWLNVIKNLVKKLKKNKLCDLFALDSMSALYALSKFTPHSARTKLFYLFEFLRDLNITSFLISEVMEEGKFGEFGVEDYLSDGIIKLVMARSGRKVRREISVVKMRQTDTNNDVFILDYTKNKFRALAKLIE